MSSGPLFLSPMMPGKAIEQNTDDKRRDLYGRRTMEAIFSEIVLEPRNEPSGPITVEPHSRGRHGAGRASVDRFRRSNQAMVY